MSPNLVKSATLTRKSRMLFLFQNERWYDHKLFWCKYPVYNHKDTSSAMAASLLTVRKFRRVYMRIMPKISGKLMNNSMLTKNCFFVQPLKNIL